MANLTVTVVDGNNLSLVVDGASANLAAAQSAIATAAATASAASASSSASSATSAANSYAAFDDRYLGSKATAPTLDNDGMALLTGALYWNTATTQLYVWTGSAWNAAAFDTTGGMVSLTGVETLTNKTITSPVIDSGTANGVTYLNASKVLTSGSALTFDGTNLGIGTSTPAANSLSISQYKNLAFSWSTGTTYANIFNKSGSAALILASGYKLSSTPYGVASSCNETWSKSAIEVGNGAINFFVDPATTVASGTDVTPTERMRIDSSGNLGIGTSSPREKLDVVGNIAAPFQDNQTIQFQYLTGSSYGLGMMADATGRGLKLFTRSGDGTGYISFSTGGMTEKMRLDFSGNLIQTVNTTAATLSANGTLTFSIVDNSTLRISVRGSDGTTRTATVALI